MTRFHHSSTRQTFSLTELLIVIAILAILLSLLRPALTSMTDRAQTMSCSKQLKELYLQSQFYAEDFNGFLPPAGGFKPEDYGCEWNNSSKESRLVTCLNGYMKGWEPVGMIGSTRHFDWGQHPITVKDKNTHELWFCPSDVDPFHSPSNWNKKLISYSIPRYVWASIGGRSGEFLQPLQVVLPMGSVRQPAVTVMFSDASMGDQFISGKSPMPMIFVEVNGNRIARPALGQIELRLSHMDRFGYNTVHFDGHTETWLYPDHSPSLESSWCQEN